MSDFTKIREDYDKGKYANPLDYDMYHLKKLPFNHIFDENKSVKWNREELEDYNKKRIELVREYNVMTVKTDERFKEDVIIVIISFGFNKVQAEHIYRYVYDEFHSSVDSMLIYMDEICDLIQKVKEAENEKR